MTLFSRTMLGLAIAAMAGAALLRSAPATESGAARGRESRAAPGRHEATTWPTSREFAAALLAETNRVRREHRLRPLAPRRELDLAADDHAGFLAVTWTLQHTSPIRGQETPSARVERRGVAPGTVAENAAVCSVGQREAQETAAEIAAMLVAQWMDSPGHRANILNRNYTQLGGSVRVVRMVESWRAYGVQVFYARSGQFAAF